MVKVIQLSGILNILQEILQKLSFLVLDFSYDMLAAAYSGRVEIRLGEILKSQTTSERDYASQRELINALRWWIGKVAQLIPSLCFLLPNTSSHLFIVLSTECFLFLQEYALSRFDAYFEQKRKLKVWMWEEWPVGYCLKRAAGQNLHCA